RLVRNAQGKEHWEFEGRGVGVFGLNPTGSWPEGGGGLHPRAAAEEGAGAAVCCPSLPGFSGRRFQEAEDKDLALVMLQAYNDWHIDEWCASHPGRFMPISIVPAWDMDATVAELRRVAAK